MFEWFTIRISSLHGADAATVNQIGNPSRGFVRFIAR